MRAKGLFDSLLRWCPGEGELGFRAALLRANERKRLIFVIAGAQLE